MFDEQRTRLLNCLDAAHDAYYRAEVFGGPSLHFHLKALEAGRDQDFEGFAEYVYAVLASWGMHRMGPGGSKMRDFGEFRSSLQEVWGAAVFLQEKTPHSIDNSDWESLRAIFCGIRCMASGTSLVGNSKVMAHLIPRLIPPVDREYTLKFLFGHGQITNDINGEWEKLARVLTGFFYPVVESPVFQRKAEEWTKQRTHFRWDTSPLKILDNLVIGVSKMLRAEKLSVSTLS
jgi:hypothetical protein